MPKLDSVGDLLRVDGQVVLAVMGETVLEACLRAGLEVSHSCLAGACQACRVRFVDGAQPRAAQSGLDPDAVKQGWFLACQARLDAPLAISLDGAAQQRAAVRLVEREWSTPEIVRLRFEWLAPFEHRAGQFVRLARADGLARSYSIASVPGLDRELELHVRVLANGALSSWLARTADLGESLVVYGPAGQCVYDVSDRDQPMLLAGTGTGLAPLIAVAREALSKRHTGRIELYHGGLDANALYAVDFLRELAETHPTFRYHASVLRGTVPRGVECAPISDLLERDQPELDGWRVHLCGAPELVEALRKQCFLAGADLRQIRADPFVAAAANHRSPLSRRPL